MIFILQTEQLKYIYKFEISISMHIINTEKRMIDPYINYKIYNRNNYLLKADNHKNKNEKKLNKIRTIIYT